MATPVVSGYAIKIRQYFLQGYYPSGFQNMTAGFVPSGALIKAMLIASAVPMQYFVFSPSAYSALPGGYPSVLQGYGRVQMSNVLNLNASASTDPLSLFIIGSANKSYPYYTEFLGKPPCCALLRAFLLSVPLCVSVCMLMTACVASTQSR